MKSIIDTLSVIKNAVTLFNKDSTHNASVALIGGYAAVYFGSERTTFDIDVCFHSQDKEPGRVFFDFLKQQLPSNFKTPPHGGKQDPTDPLKHDIITISDAEEKYPGSSGFCVGKNSLPFKGRVRVGMGQGRYAFFSPLRLRGYEGELRILSKMKFNSPQDEGNSPWGAMAVLTGVTIFVVIVVALHFLQPGYDPVNQLMSELALGRYGWAMILAFAGVAFAFMGLQSVLAIYGASKVLRSLLLIDALLFIAAGIFTLRESPAIHILAIATAFIVSVLAMIIFPSEAGQVAIAAPRSVSWTLAFGIAVSVALSNSFIPIGIGQRLAAFYLLSWLLILGWRLRNDKSLKSLDTAQEV